MVGEKVTIGTLVVLLSSDELRTYPPSPCLPQLETSAALSTTMVAHSTLHCAGCYVATRLLHRNIGT
eukprot:12931891-Prorocentrum_lima.AAC.1